MCERDILVHFPHSFPFASIIFLVTTIFSDASFLLSSASCLEERELFAKFSPDYLLKISRNIDELLYKSVPKVSADMQLLYIT
jgi:hypothetical protein